MDRLKKCSKCLSLLPHSAFTKCKRRLDGHYPQCRKCRAANYRRDKRQIGEKQRARYEANREEVIARVLAYRVANPEKVRATQRRKYKKNKDRIIEKTKQWHEANPGKVKQAKRKWKEKNPEAVAVYSRNRRARLKKVGGTHTVGDIRFLMKIQKGKCAHPWCRKSLKVGRHVDHRVPIVLGGDNGRSNIQLLCPDCNYKKHTKHPIDFAQANGMLL